MAANNTYIDKNGDRRWRKDAICPALGGEKTCRQHLQDGADFELAYARKIARAKKRKGTKVKPPNVPIGCRGYLYPQDACWSGQDLPDEPPECLAFQCATCGKNVPWSFGCGDEYLYDCDDCAVKKLRREGKLP